MDYQALYRKYRPQTFEDVIGQSHVTTTLAREVAEDHVAHAYLFTGPRGTGKTTTARILAKALNCPNRDSHGSPCNECPSCEAITTGNSFDVMELDAASHNSVDDIREIKVSVSTVASSATSRRVFVLDEAHMLSKAAGNALLKTLEEPPANVHFVLATTEPYKLLDTIRSRSQRFDFHPVPIEELAGHLSGISDRESFKADPQALISIGRHAGGSVRDALSLLEQVAALGAGTVDTDGVRRALGLADSEAFMRLAEAVASEDARSALELVAELAAQGVDLRRFVAESISFFRGAFLAHYAPNLAEIADEPEEVYESWKKAASLVRSSEVLRAVDLLGEALVRLREGREERLMTELALIKLTRPETSNDQGALLSRIERMERKIDAQASAPRPVTTATPSSPAKPKPIAPSPDPEADPTDNFETPAPKEEPAEVPETTTEELPELDITLEQLNNVWAGLFGSLRDVLGARRWAYFREAVPAGVQGNTIILEVAHDFHYQSLNADDAVTSIVATRASDLLGSQVKVRFRLKAGSPAGSADASEEQIDLDDLEERAEGSSDPTDLLAAELGAEVVDD
ncbi:MAG: DNA polymerase III subunit gamma/tau [Acidimicrobiia bacterium]